MPITDPLLLRQWHPLRNGDLSPRQVSPGSHRKVWWRCDRGHEWQAEVKSRALLGTGCPVCAGKAVLTGIFTAGQRCCGQQGETEGQDAQQT